MRHGERLDDIFGEWYSYCKNENGQYRQSDLNMPTDLLPLNRPLDEYENDTPLTVLGNVMAQMVGRTMLVSGRSPDMVYCSPSLRCVQTASVAAAMTGKPFKLRIEPGIFENFDLYTRKTPKFVTVEELKNSGFNIDDDYTPYCKLEDLFSFPETSEMYNDRVQSSLQYIANKSAPGRGTVFVAAHASTVDLAFGKFHSRFLKEPRQTTAENLINISVPIPYSSNVTFMRSSDDDQWQYIREALPPITYRNFSNRLNHDFIERYLTFEDSDKVSDGVDRLNIGRQMCGADNSDEDMEVDDGPISEQRRNFTKYDVAAAVKWADYYAVTIEEYIFGHLESFLENATVVMIQLYGLGAIDQNEVVSRLLYVERVAGPTQLAISMKLRDRFRHKYPESILSSQDPVHDDAEKQYLRDNAILVVEGEEFKHNEFTGMDALGSTQNAKFIVMMIRPFPNMLPAFIKAHLNVLSQIIFIGPDPTSVASDCDPHFKAIMNDFAEFCVNPVNLEFNTDSFGEQCFGDDTWIYQISESNAKHLFDVYDE